MIISYKSLDKVQFPVFKLPSDNWSIDDGLFTVDGMLIDDKNMPGDTLGMRRIQTPLVLGKLNQSINSITGIIKNKTNTAYIDSKGRYFVYEKTKMCTLKYHKITQVVRKGHGCSVHVFGVQAGFAVPRPPESDIEFVGVLYFHKLPWKLYEFSTDRKKNRKVKI
jgi:hypothetical protein